MMDTAGGHRNSVLKQRNLIVFGFIRIASTSLKKVESAIKDGIKNAIFDKKNLLHTCFTLVTSVIVQNNS